MREKNTTLLSLVLLCVLLGAVPAMAQAGDTNTQGDFRWIVAPYAWLTGLNGTIGAKGHDTKVNAPFVNLAKYFEIGGMIHLEGLYRERVGLFTDFSYSLLGDETSGKRVSLDGKTSLLLTDVAAFYRVGKFPLGQADNDDMTFDVLAGARIWSLSLMLNSDRRWGGRDLFKNRTWVDPIVGIRTEFHFGKSWRLSLRGGVGGFSISSAITWDATAALGYSLWDHGTLLLGYRAVGVNHDEGSGKNAFKFDATLSGPILGLAFTF